MTKGRNSIPASPATAPHVPPRSTMGSTATTSAPNARTTEAASNGEVPRVTVSSVMTTRSPGSRAPARRPSTPWSLDSLRMLNDRRNRPRLAATAAMPKATGSAPAVSPPMAVIGSTPSAAAAASRASISTSAASATSRIPSARHAVCLASQNQVLFRPDLRVKSPVLMECSSRWAIRASLVLMIPS